MCAHQPWHSASVVVNMDAWLSDSDEEADVQSSDKDGVEVQVTFECLSKDQALHVPKTPFSISVKLGRFGLSEVINHLLELGNCLYSGHQLLQS